ncbi:MAG: riboflavin synthase [Desulfobacterales bacterium]|jgi:riboflavin synthase
MFTGIIEGLGTLAAIRSSGRGRRLVIESDFDLDGTRIGDSIAVNGACLTAVRIANRRFEIDLSPESLATTTFGEARTGDRLNLERALRLSDRLDGHLVSGHVDGVGMLASRQRLGNALLIRVDIPPSLTRYMIRKGSVALDGVSLTINRCHDTALDVSIIPHTAQLTTIGFKPVGSRINIETDMIGKYVERFTGAASGEAESASRIDREFLIKAGFL